ncbi:MAG: S1 RNA-binding domain-containing protein, partial [Clostridiales bacterium]|nr:S1 RNA-binding domain-containing protein [Clostridiales bacterium]
HFGLASKFYCHFTSPIRRYPDLYIHRIIKSNIHGEDLRRFFAGNVENVAGQSSEMERNSVDAERASVDIKACEYMKDKIGEKFPGIITSIIEAGVFVELESSVEGFVPFRSMRDHFLFDDRTYRAMGVRSGKKLMIGQEVEVVVAAVDEDSRHIDFVFDPEFEQKDTVQSIRPKKEKDKEKRKGKRRRYRY